MNISLSNFSKPTPPKARNIGNAVVFMCLAAQPLIADAGADIISHRGKFWATFMVSVVGAGIKGYTMLLADEPKSDPNTPKE